MYRFYSRLVKNTYENIPSPYSPNICMFKHEVMVNVLNEMF